MTPIPDKRAWILDLLDRHEASLTHYAARLLGDVERARDVVQEAFLRLWKAEDVDAIDAAAPWLYTVCRNLAFDVLRKEKRMVSLVTDELPGEDPGEAHASAEQQEGLSQVLAALHALPKSQQEVIRLKFQNGLSYKDISRVTGHSVSNVGVLIHTGLKKLRAAMKGGAQ